MWKGLEAKGNGKLDKIMPNEKCIGVVGSE
jgi:hypothetical protein